MIRVAMKTPWVERALARDPMESMEITRILWAGDGIIRLSAKSSKGPFQAIYHAPGDDTFDGRRALGNTVLAAVKQAVES